MRSTFFNATLIAFTSFSFIVSGCGGGAEGPALGRVTGNVSFDDKPLEGALVTFNPIAGGRGSSGITDSSGRYQLDYTYDQAGAIRGEHEVRINSAAFSGEGAKDPILPPVYNSESQLKVNVKLGSNTFDFPLKSDGSSIAIK